MRFIVEGGSNLVRESVSVPCEPGTRVGRCLKYQAIVDESIDGAKYKMNNYGEKSVVIRAGDKHTRNCES